jgi:hypothetical protein
VKNKIGDLRDHLFMTLEDLRDKEKPMEIDRALAVAEVAQVIVNSAKAENDFLRLSGQRGSAFIPVQGAQPELPTPPGQPRLVRGA